MENEKKEACSCKEIKGITCDVRNCVHHDCNNGCTAGNVSIGPSYALSSSETVCATFQPKEV